MTEEIKESKNVSPRAPYLDLQQSASFEALNYRPESRVRKNTSLGYYVMQFNSGNGEHKVSGESLERVNGADITEERKFRCVFELVLHSESNLN